MYAFLTEDNHVKEHKVLIKMLLPKYSIKIAKMLKT